MSHSLRNALTAFAAVMVSAALSSSRAWAQCPVYSNQWFPSGTSPSLEIHPLAADRAGNTYVGDMANGRIMKFTSDGALLTQWGSFGTGDGQFSDRDGVAIAVDGADNVYVLDRGGKRIQRFTSSGAYVAQWPVHPDSSTLGLPTRPVSIAVDRAGNNVYVADLNTYHIQKFTTAGEFLTQWGSIGTGDGQFSRGPFGITVDPGGFVYVAEEGHAVHVFTSEGGFINRWDAGASSLLYGIAADGAGNVYVVDQGHGPCCPSSIHRVKMFSSSGALLCEWGSYGDGDGEFYWPYWVAVDDAGSVYVSDYRVQRFVQAPVPATVATWGKLKASYR